MVEFAFFWNNHVLSLYGRIFQVNKYQEALEYLTEEAYSNYFRKYVQTSKEKVFLFKSAEALQELVNKATPKKPKNWKAERRVNGKVEFNCPVCNRIYNERVNFCASCGQAIDWSTDDE